MHDRPTDSGSSGAFLQLRDFAEKKGVSSHDAEQELRAVLKRLRQGNPRVPETVFFVAGLRGMSGFAEDAARRVAFGPACAMSAHDWCEAAESVDDALTPDVRERVREEIERLPDGLAAIYRMLILRGESYAAIAQQLGMSVESVRASVFRAKEILRGRLGSLVMPTP